MGRNYNHCLIRFYYMNITENELFVFTYFAHFSIIPLIIIIDHNNGKKKSWTVFSVIFTVFLQNESVSNNNIKYFLILTKVSNYTLRLIFWSVMFSNMYYCLRFASRQQLEINQFSLLTHFMLLLFFYTPSAHQKSRVFLTSRFLLFINCY